jgi:hypothetical protein
MPSILHRLFPSLPEVVVDSIDAYLGGDDYWKARYRLTLYNARLNLFQSDWWSSWRTYLCWYHWRLRNPQCSHGSCDGNNDKHARNIHSLTNTNKMPQYCSWVVDADARVLMMLRLFKSSLRSADMLEMMTTRLDENIAYWLLLAREFRLVVHG